ncbi:hypothetical protein PYK22_02421 [Pyrinomonas methylaliphatogenes]|uniref:Uncharacterized protein n=1 Tax=Pyrinomonas methylaliphatogenes TaxID=454194 RepID=A0A0B6WZ54_9BACT|nr:hypothetical protein PYK22_02421 [Pyrinomonas methylaliphatogenes]
MEPVNRDTRPEVSVLVWNNLRKMRVHRATGSFESSLLSDGGGDSAAPEDLSVEKGVKQSKSGKLELVYTIFCDDVRLEVGNKLSLMGIFQNIMVQQLPVSLIKFAVVNHWRGEGAYLSEVRILSPDRQYPIVVSQPTRFEVAPGGFADNISFFVNVTFPVAGRYWVQTLVDSSLFDEQPLVVMDARAQMLDGATESVN